MAVVEARARGCRSGGATKAARPRSHLLRFSALARLALTRASSSTCPASAKTAGVAVHLVTARGGVCSTRGRGEGRARGIRAADVGNEDAAQVAPYVAVRAALAGPQRAMLARGGAAMLTVSLRTNFCTSGFLDLLPTNCPLCRSAWAVGNGRSTGDCGRRGGGPARRAGWRAREAARRRWAAADGSGQGALERQRVSARWAPPRRREHWGRLARSQTKCRRRTNARPHCTVRAVRCTADPQEPPPRLRAS